MALHPEIGVRQNFELRSGPLGFESALTVVRLELNIPIRPKFPTEKRPKGCFRLDIAVATSNIPSGFQDASRVWLSRLSNSLRLSI